MLLCMTDSNRTKLDSYIMPSFLSSKDLLKCVCVLFLFLCQVEGGEKFQTDQAEASKPV